MYCSNGLGARHLITCFAVALLAACGSNDSVQLGSVHVKSQPINAGGGSIEIFAADVNEASKRLIGAKVSVPAGALDSEKIITIGLDTNDLTLDDTDAAGITVVLGPDKTQFAKPVEITLPYEGDANDDLFRVMVVESDGSSSIVLPEQMIYDAAAKTVRFEAEHFTRFQSRRARRPCSNLRCPSGHCRRGRCVPPPNSCNDPASCGPQPGVPTWTCEDGTVGGSTGRCLANQDGTCGWEIRWCPRECTADECGPAPGAPNFQCQDGTVGGPGECRRRADGSCGYDFNQCPDDCTAANTPCPQGQVCDAATRRCQPAGGTQCGNNVCGQGEYCCNSSCGICAPVGAACTQQQCNACQNGQLCGPGQQCDPATGQCSPICDAASCGPQPGVPSWTCEDGTQGGSTGRCIPQANGQCGWEIIYCPQQCDPAQCQNSPGGLRPCATTCSRDANGQCANICESECTAQECGPQPALPNYVCQDGQTVAGPTGRCLRSANTNQCGWEVISCPP